MNGGSLALSHPSALGSVSPSEAPYRAAVKAGDQKHTIVERRKRKATDLTHLTLLPETLDTGFEPNKKSSQADKTELRQVALLLAWPWVTIMPF